MSLSFGIRLVPGVVAVFAIASLFSTAPIASDASSPLLIDARKSPEPAHELPFSSGGRSPDGHVISINSRYLLLDGTPWLPVMGEFHFARYPAADWEQEILKMKAGGVQVVSTYVFWIYHEEIEGQFDWAEQRDLRRFMALCAKNGMYVWLRVGPWAHGESRNGGLPDWLLQRGPTRQNDPEYLAKVRKFYGEIGKQVKGLFWKDGGPIIGLQIENEYGARGAGKGAEHILELQRLAREAGLNAPFYTVTGWDGVEVPSREVLPVFSGYADGFWFRSQGELPPNANYFFSAIRCEENVGDGLRSKRPDIDSRYKDYPFLTAEMGGGMAIAYHRRPLISADDTAAMALVKLGSGAALYGYYMFHGGTNPEGKGETLQESQATGYPNDLPVKSYDFQAPLGEFGQMNPSFRDVKMLHLFLQDFGANLAPMTPYFPERAPSSRTDTETPRVAARTKENAGFVFVNNYQRIYPLAERKNFQVRLNLASEAVAVPQNPVNIPAGAYTFWPVNLKLDGVLLQYATAQLLCKLDQENTYVFFAWPGMDAEFAFDTLGGVNVVSPHGRVTAKGNHIYVDRIQPGSEVAIRVQRPKGKDLRILLLSRDQARNVWKAKLEGRERLLLSSADLFFEQSRIHVRTREAGELMVGIFPKLSHDVPGFSSVSESGIFTEYRAQVGPAVMEPHVQKIKDAERSNPVKMGREVALAPEDSDFETAAHWSIRVPSKKIRGLSNVFLKVEYQGDVARIYAGNRLITDDFYKGTPWEIGLQRVSAQELDRGLDLKILPLRKDAPIFLPTGARPAFPASGDAVSLKSVQVIPEYEAVIDLRP